jgi:hypothetical protein
MIRKFLAREGQFLLQEFGAPDGRTLWRRIAFYTWVYTATAAVLLGLVAIYDAFGLPAMCGMIFLLFILYLRLQRRAPLYFEGEMLQLGGDLPPSLPPPGAQALPPPGRQAQIGGANQALTKHRPALPKRSP